MSIHQEAFSVSTQGNTEVVDLTGRVGEIVRRSGILKGLATVFMPGSTAGITTIEFEPGLIQDIKKAAEKWASKKTKYKHHLTGDDNGRAHVLSALIGASVSIPVEDRRPQLGTWQQVVLLDFDTRPRDRRVIVQVMGE
ncbi:MAG: YjbQ family protein [Elusimicrobia bacterium]|nr:YjbQ family protein [Elusimicrobiota bacterium]